MLSNNKIFTCLNSTVKKIVLKEKLNELFYLTDELTELNELKSILLKKNSSLHKYNLKTNDNEISKKKINCFKNEVYNLKYEIVKLLNNTGLLYYIMRDSELYWNKKFLKNKDMCVSIYDIIHDNFDIFNYLKLYFKDNQHIV